MSIIGHSIQSGVVNIHMALREQQAGQAAQSDEDVRRQAAVERSDQVAREGIVETSQTRQTRVHNPPERGRGGGEGREDSEEDEDGDHIDVLA
jgi:hypothetical protein